MKNRWSDGDAAAFVASKTSSIAPEFAQVIYATRLLGSEPDLAMHGGGNTSLKGTAANFLGDTRPALFIKASGCALTDATEKDFTVLDYDTLMRITGSRQWDDAAMADAFRFSLLRPGPRLPSIETPLHALLPHAVIMHTHPAAVLALTNRHDARACISEALGTQVAVMPYFAAGFACGIEALETVRREARCSGLVIGHHGLVTWGETAKEAYAATIRFVSLAETCLAGKKIRALSFPQHGAPAGEPAVTYAAIAPVVRGTLSPASGNPDAPSRKIVLKLLEDEALRELIGSREGRRIAVTSPLTPDYLIRVRRFPLFIEDPRLDDTASLRAQIVASLDRYYDEYRAFIGRVNPAAAPVDDAMIYPKAILIPGIGCICIGENEEDAAMAADIMAQGLAVKRTIYETGGEYIPLSDEHGFDMEFRAYQRAKMKPGAGDTVSGAIVLVTGAAGAIGMGICAALFEAGCQVAAADLPGAALDAAVQEFTDRFGSDRVLGTPLDVTDPDSVAQGFGRIVRRFGGLDGVVVNAGIAHVSPLVDMDLDAFRKLERVNVEGTLLTIREAARLFTLQGIGGDIVLISTKNVFAPGASFGAYSATKAASHQLARIAALELAPIGVRVNMVAPDAVFSHQGRKSGLWATVGPGRMRARGLDEAGLEEYYRSRNLLKAKVTADHVAAAVLFFLARKTPTTGATIPVDGGLPDATPR
jgi:rhamnose utilization protein RhaD (predicted bifunctional aldolase and dehydrogenase)/NAD(P)-dependent dehydrogenase (short-subunit alcohol dehydrogenase family)